MSSFIPPFGHSAPPRAQLPDKAEELRGMRSPDSMFDRDSLASRCRAHDAVSWVFMAKPAVQDSADFRVIIRKLFHESAFVNLRAPIPRDALQDVANINLKGPDTRYLTSSFSRLARPGPVSLNVSSHRRGIRCAGPAGGAPPASRGYR